ncbi:MAG: hypothetical protein Q4B72_15595 [Lachnospiraceae bacterium]|nr:hypothetical protein [Lachnospiraceae bacterium]
MKNKRMISILLVIVLLTLQTVIVQARENETEKRISGAITEVFINPLYAGIIKTSDLLEPETAIASTYAEEEYLTSTEACAEQIREKMKQREETIVVYYQASEYSKQALVDMINQAVAHTGDPKEGDYLKWQYGGIKSSTQYYVSDDVTYMTISFAVTYYTTSEQENVVDEKIEFFLNLRLQIKMIMKK